MSMENKPAVDVEEQQKPEEKQENHKLIQLYEELNLVSG